MELGLLFSPLRPCSLFSPPKKPLLGSLFSVPRPFPVFPSSINASRAAIKLRLTRSSCLSRADDGEGISELTSSPMSGRDLNSESFGIWKQMKEIALFAGPATGLWICEPLMSLINTMVIGQASSLELAALGPGTLFCDDLSYIFMFLSIATSNIVATSLAKKDESLVQHQISMLLFVAFACGLGMFLFTKILGTRVLAAFTGLENAHIVPAADTYVQIRAFAWPAVLVGLVAQSARYAPILFIPGKGFVWK